MGGVEAARRPGAGMDAKVDACLQPFAEVTVCVIYATFLRVGVTKYRYSQ